jgi:flagellar hook protein FlgE
MSSSLWIGTTGLTSAEKQMDVIGNNLANAHTVGFKASDTYFASMLSQNLSGGSQRVGQGVSVVAVSTMFGQGSFQSTGNSTDVAIDGSGFFIVQDREGGTLYTRAGAFAVTKDGLLCDSNNYKVMGHVFDDDGNVESQAMTAMDLRNIQSKPKASTFFNIGLTLDSQTEAGGTFDSSQILYDSRGAQHTLGTTFTKTENANYWSMQNSLDGNAATSQSCTGIRFDPNGVVEKIYSSVATPTITTAGTGDAVMTYNKNGQMYKNTTAPITLTRGANADTWVITDDGGYDNMTITLGTTGTDDQVSIDFDGTGGADVTFALSDVWAQNDTIALGVVQTEQDPTDIAVRFYASGGSLSDGAEIGIDGVLNWNFEGDDSNSINSFATTSRISALSSDGYAPGTVSSLAVDKNGVIEGMFSNGQRQKLARLMLADFPAIQGLTVVGSYFSETGESGAAVNNKPGSGGLGKLQSNSLEISNTDVAREFIKMISAQRAYQSSAKIITTADQMLQQLMNIKQ